MPMFTNISDEIHINKMKLFTTKLFLFEVRYGIIKIDQRKGGENMLDEIEKVLRVIFYIASVSWITKQWLDKDDKKD